MTGTACVNGSASGNTKVCALGGRSEAPWVAGQRFALAPGAPSRRRQSGGGVGGSTRVACLQSPSCPGVRTLEQVCKGLADRVAGQRWSSGRSCEQRSATAAMAAAQQKATQPQWWVWSQLPVSRRQRPEPFRRPQLRPFGPPRHDAMRSRPCLVSIARLRAGCRCMPRPPPPPPTAAANSDMVPALSSSLFVPQEACSSRRHSWPGCYPGPAPTGRGEDAAAGCVLWACCGHCCPPPHLKLQLCL